MKGVYAKTYIDLDGYIDLEEFHSLYDEMIMGISKSHIDKGVVSCGVHPKEKELELCTVLQNPNEYLSAKDIENLDKLDNLHQRAWYVSLRLPVYHPYFLVFIRRERDFWKKHLRDNCEWTQQAKLFPQTLEFIEKLPFDEIGRILFFITSSQHRTLIHYDAGNPEARRAHPNTEFIYFRPGLEKKLFIYDEDKDEKHYVKSCASYWNDLDWHGVDQNVKTTFSMRVDGVFQDKFRKEISLISNV